MSGGFSVLDHFLEQVNSDGMILGSNCHNGSYCGESCSYLGRQLLSTAQKITKYLSQCSIVQKVHSFNHSLIQQIFLSYYNMLSVFLEIQ